jgi:hypothetical protein
MGHQYRIPVSAEGALVLPEEVRKQLLEHGGLLIARNENGRLIFDVVEDPVALAQDMVRHYLGDTAGSVDDFIASRHIDSGE